VKLKPGLSWQKQVSTKKTLFTCKLDFSLRKKLVQRNTWNIVLYGAETCKLREVDQEYLESFEMLCWRRMEKISWTDRVQNEKKYNIESRRRGISYIPQKRRKANWIGNIFCRKCLLQHVIEGKREEG
jgi:hypothetical protein